MPFDLSQYETVEERLAKFWADHPQGRVLTELVSHSDGEWVFRSAVHTNAEDEMPAATGYAHEKQDSSPVNKTSACENCETSAIGRALANLGYAPKGARPSREEMQKTQGRATPRETTRTDPAQGAAVPPAAAAAPVLPVSTIETLQSRVSAYNAAKKKGDRSIADERTQKGLPPLHQVTSLDEVQGWDALMSELEQWPVLA